MYLRDGYKMYLFVSYSLFNTNFFKLCLFQQMCQCFVLAFTLSHCSPSGGGGTLKISYIRRLGPFFWGQISEFQYFFGFSEK